jgi:hypothetical protein
MGIKKTKEYETTQQQVERLNILASMQEGYDD